MTIIKTIDPLNLYLLIKYTENFQIPPGVIPYQFKEFLQTIMVQANAYPNPIPNRTDNVLRNYLLAAYPKEPWRFAVSPHPLPPLHQPEPRERIAYDFDVYKRPPEPGDMEYRAPKKETTAQQKAWRRAYGDRARARAAAFWASRGE